MPVDQVIPPGLPPPLSEFAYEPVDIAETVPRDQGELRRIPLYTIVPRAVPVTWVLTQAMLNTYFDWFEGDLQAGGLQFDLRLERLGGPGAGSNPRLTWWTAQFISPPETLVVRDGQFEVTANLLLIGEPFDDRVAPGILASGNNGHSGGAFILGAPGFAAAGNNGHSGGAVFPVGTSWFAEGGNGHSGGWFTDIAP